MFRITMFKANDYCTKPPKIVKSFYPPINIKPPTPYFSTKSSFSSAKDVPIKKEYKENDTSEYSRLLDRQGRAIVSQLEKHLAQNPNDLEAVLDTVFKLLYHHKDTTNAMRCYDRFLAINPNHKEGLYRKGCLFWMTRKPLAAIQYCDKALAIDPHYQEAIELKEKVRQELGKHLHNKGMDEGPSRF